MRRLRQFREMPQMFRNHGVGRKKKQTSLFLVRDIKAHSGILPLLQGAPSDREKAWAATKALAFGYGLAAGIRLVMGFVMVCLWLITVIFL